MKHLASLWAVALLLFAVSPAFSQGPVNAASGGSSAAAKTTAAPRAPGSPPAAAPDAVRDAHGAAISSDTNTDVGKAGNASATAVIKLFVLAAVLESALALLFNWRPFVAVFDGRGLKSVISLIASWVLVGSFNIDVVQDLMHAYGSATTTPFSELITAMVVAGGSGGVNKLLRTLGFREVVGADDVIAKPPPTAAWLAVVFVKQNQSKGAVYVEVNEAGAGFRTAGMIANPSRMTAMTSYFLRDPGRLPMSGGMNVTPNVPLQVRLSGVDANGTPVTATSIWNSNGLMAGAIVNVSLSL